MQFPEDGKCHPATFQIDSLQVARMIKSGNVNFKESLVREKPCKLYRVNAENLGTDYEMMIALCDSSSELKWIREVGAEIFCD